MTSSTLYLQRLKTLLQTEYDAEREDFIAQNERMGIERRIRRGICWYPVSVGRSYYNSLNQYVVEIFRQQTEKTIENEEEAMDDIDHLFEYGKPVQFFEIKEPGSQSTPLGGKECNCTVSYVDGDRMVVTLPSPQLLMDIERAEHLGVNLYFDETSYKMMFNALNDVCNARNNRLADLRDIFAGHIKPEKRTFAPIVFPWLNNTQQAAVNEVLWAKDVAVVHGPPGTGKTTTLVEAIYETLRRETQVLVCAQSNMAVDWISEQLVDHGISVLRIGNPSRVNDKMLSFTYEHRFESHPDYSELWAIRKTIRQIRENRKRGDNTHQKVARLRERAQELEMQIHASLFNEARVVACTLVGASNKLLVRQRFSTLFIDEAAQALEPACWIAIRRASRVILAGDHQQLPPTVKSYEAMRQGLGVTLMERIVKNLPQCVTQLNVQYRMNDDIMRFSSDWFYGGKLQSHPSVQHRGILDYDTPMEWIVTESPEEFVGETHGRINKAEAELLISTLTDYISHIGKTRFISEHIDIGIISPYKVQTQYIRRLVRRNAELRQLRSQISVNTVDGFQGQERDVIIISLVRSNEQGQIGFLNDLRRMNVAITRARMKLIVLGDAATLSHHPFYRKLYEYIRKLNDNDTLRYDNDNQNDVSASLQIDENLNLNTNEKNNEENIFDCPCTDNSVSHDNLCTGD